MSHRALNDNSLAVLCSSIKENRATAANAGEAVVQLSEAMQQGFKEVEDALNDLPSATSFSIPVTGWTKDTEETSGYPYHYDLTVEGIGAEDFPIVTVAPSGQATARSCGLCPTCESLAGVIRLWAESVPTTSIAAEYWIVDGKAEDTASTS